MRVVFSGDPACLVGFVLHVDGSGPFPIDFYKTLPPLLLLISSEVFRVAFSNVFSSKVNWALKRSFSSYLLSLASPDLPKSAL